MESTVALIGFGEAGSTFARAAGWGTAACGYDIDPAREPAMADHGVRPGASAAEAVRDAPIVLSLVTADAALAAARDYAPLLAPGTIWCDMNSVAPQTKREACEAVTAAGGRYVDCAILAPVQPGALAVPLLLAGQAAADAVTMLAALGFTNLRVVGDEVGRASTIKLCRSVAVKGIEAICAEMALAAARAGVLDEVLASLDASEKPQSWAQRVDYNLDRMLLHGRRRSAEMFEASEMLRDLGIAPLVTDGTVQWQEGIGELGIAPPAGLAAKLEAIVQSPEFKGEI
ncbi:MAG: NAD(P)-dependent oxidoreductase [Sphingomonadales bacterium]|nr:NAD(P)-dependent oxidoreductase [Sphingomonadales bacterium]MBD3773522.1 NAD(P)-dependent oxidoreductase [Paracoccaceae bacterium]